MDNTLTLQFSSKDEKQLFKEQYNRYKGTCELIAKYINPMDKICLDIGCGTGNGILALKKFGAKKVIGIDDDLNFMGGTLMHKIAEAEKIDLSGCERVNGEIETYQFNQKYFDIIVLYDVLEHLSNPLSVLSAAKKLLKSDGTLFISTSPLYFSPVGHHCWNLYPRDQYPWVHLYTSGFYDKVVSQHSWCGESFRGLNKLTKSEILNLLDKLDFEIIKEDFSLVNESLENHPEKNKIINCVDNEEDLYIEGINLVLKKKTNQGNKNILKISFVNGAITKNDAISNIFLDKIRAVDEYYAKKNIPYKIKIFVYGSDHVDERIVTVQDISKLLKQPHFIGSDIVFYDFGIFYELFNSISIIHKSAITIVQYYGITPSQFVSDDFKKYIRKSLEQEKLISLADKIIVYSKNTKNDLISIGISENKIYSTIVPISFQLADIKKKLTKNIVNFLYVGRFVKSKGIFDLLKACYMLLKTGFSEFELNLVGSLTYSDKNYIEHLKSYISHNNLSDHVNFVGSATKKELINFYNISDAFIIPSYHEGYCIPVIEALFFGCYIISYDSPNLPDILNGFGSLIPTGDIEMLFNAMLDYCKFKTGKIKFLKSKNCEMSQEDFFKNSFEYASSFTYDKYKKGINDILKTISLDIKKTNTPLHNSYTAIFNNSKLTVKHKLRIILSDVNLTSFYKLN